MTKPYEKNNTRTRAVYNMTICALFAAVICVLSPITVQIGPVPITMGILGVMLASVVLGPIKGFVSVAVYLGVGIVGAPIFSGGKSGIPALIGPTGGYIWSYLLMALSIGVLTLRPIYHVDGKHRANVLLYVIQTVFACLIATLICYAGGTLQFSLLTGTEFDAALKICIYPFTAFDAIKCVIAGTFGYELRVSLAKAGYMDAAVPFTKSGKLSEN